MQRNLVGRIRRNDDKRAYDVSLTEQGRQTLDELTPAANDIYAGIAHDLGQSETKELLRLLRKLAAINN